MDQRVTASRIAILATAFAMACSPAERSESVADSTATEVDSLELERSRADDAPEEVIVDGGDDQRGFEENKAEATFLGFSDDLKYAAFDMSWVRIDAPGSYVNLYFIDVDKNDYAIKPIQNESAELGLSERVDETHKMAEAQFAKFGINGQNVGVEHPLEPEKETNQIQANGAIYDLRLIQRDVEVNKKIFEVQLIHDGNVKVLQKDTKLPASRGPVTAYRWAKAYTSNNKIAVFIEYDREITENAEGYSVVESRQLIVTGVLN